MSDHVTILYITDNELDDRIASVCKKTLLKAAEGKRLITVSQKPMDFGENVCVGEIGRSQLNINLQILEGLKRTTTKFIAVAEHDCLYTSEHFNWIPPKEDYFYFNKNCWLLQYCNKKHPNYDGMFSYKRRHLHSQLIVGVDAFTEATNEQIAILSGHGRNPLSRRLKARKHILNDHGRFFSTKVPNVDIRHGNNFTGARRGKRRCWSLDPWGTMEDILSE